MVKTIAIGLWLLLVAGALHAVTARTWTFAKRDFELLEPPPLTELDPRVLDLVTLGYSGLYDDFIYLWTLQTLADPRLQTMDPETVQASLLQVTRHQPEIETLYMLSCFVLAFDMKRPDLCERVTLDGLKAVPDGWRIPLTQGFLYALQMNDLKNGAMYYGLAASRRDAPEFIGPMTQKMIQENQLSITELQDTLARLLDGSTGAPRPGGRGASRFGPFLESLMRERR